MRAASSTPTALIPSNTSFSTVTSPTRNPAPRARSSREASGARSRRRSPAAASSATPVKPYRAADPFSRWARTTSDAMSSFEGGSAAVSSASPSSRDPAVSQASMRKMPSSSSRSRRSAMRSLSYPA